MNPHNFLLHLRNDHPWGARLFDGIRTMGLSGGTLEVKIDAALWPGTEMSTRAGELERIATAFFNRPITLKIIDSPETGERIPFPLAATKYWNHIAFLHLGVDGSSALYAVRKNDYAGTPEGVPLAPGGDSFTFSRSGQEGSALDNHLLALAPMLDLMAAKARVLSSYVQVVTPFPGHAAAETLEGRWCSIKEWGTPSTPPAILQKFTGRIHYLHPPAASRGLSFARGLVGAAD